VAQSVQHDTWEARHSATWSARKALRGSHGSPNSVVNTNGVLTHGGASRDLLDPLPAAHAPQDAHASWGERHRPPGLLDLGVGGSTCSPPTQARAPAPNGEADRHSQQVGRGLIGPSRLPKNQFSAGLPY
jgi:hypothetical protein